MSNRVYRINQYRFSSTDSLLFDANVWLYIYGPQNNLSLRFRTIYSAALGRSRSASCRIFIDVLVLSEFINTSARLAYNQLTQVIRPTDFKSFRKSAAYKPIAAKIARDSQRIIKKCDRVESGFELVDLDTLLDDYATGNADFNDQIIAELCRTKELKLVTHDADF